MTRVPVPSTFDRGRVRIAPERASESLVIGGDPRNADIVTADIDDPRDPVVREDEDGRYVGVPEYLADRVRQFFREEYGATYDDAEGAAADTCQVEKADGEVCGREKPCPYHDDAED